MKKLFTVTERLSIFVAEEGRVYELCDWETAERRYCDAAGRLLLNYQPAEDEESIYDNQRTEDKTQVTPMIDGFYGYSTHKVTYHPDGMDGLFGVKAKDGTKITEEIFAEVDECFTYGLLSVRNAEKLWGSIDEKGNLVIPYKFHEPLRFNQYGVAVGDNTLVDREGNKIPGTELNYEEHCAVSYRYFTTALLSEVQCESIAACGRAENILLDIYDTKLRRYVAKGVPDGKLDTHFFEGEEEVILAAMTLLSDFEKITLDETGTILAKKNGSVTVYDYYLD